MNKKLKFIGIDGCRSGWFFAGLDKKLDYSIGVISTISELNKISAPNSIILIDIPIGLRERHRVERLCDLEARKLLKKRCSSIFPAPSRSALTQSDYHSASQINYECTGRRLSKQTYNIMPKIKEVDDFIPTVSKKMEIQEFHPELSFLALNEFKPLGFSKKTVEGLQERQKILEKYLKQTPEIVQEAKGLFLRKHVAADDIVDALSGAVTAMLNNRLCSIPQNPEIDKKGLKMKIVYPKMERKCH